VSSKDRFTEFLTVFLGGEKFYSSKLEPPMSSGIVGVEGAIINVEWASRRTPCAIDFALQHGADAVRCFVGVQAE
jgi:hypothetical protein